MTKYIFYSLFAIVFGTTTASAQTWVNGPFGPVYRPGMTSAITSQTHITCMNPWTGGINTGNTQINKSAFDYGREAGRFNQRWVRRPVTDAYGRLTGYEQGMVWRNPITGREHGNTNIVTPNGLGGVNKTTNVYSARSGQRR